MKSTTDYQGDFQYENGILQFISQPEGYIYKDATGYRYVYQYKDHLGNNRLSFMRNAGTVAIVKETNYYPFGLTQKGYNNLTTSLGSAGAKKYQYNGKELQDDYGLEWYDYGARFYDAGLGRFQTQDWFAEKYFDYTPYQYAGNNPISNIDFKGDSIIKVTINDKSGYIKGQSTLYIDHTIFSDTKTILEYAASNEIPIHINSSFRTNKKQGGLTSANSTTPAKKSKSAHNAGLAIDFNLYKNDKVSDGVDKGNSTVTKDHKLIKKVTGMSWRWGGNWKKPDKIHIDKRGTDSNFTTIRDANQKQMDGDNKKEVDETLIKRTETITIKKKEL